MFEHTIVIPYRDRQEEYLKTAWPLLQQHLFPSRLVVVEQEAGKAFNRGKLLNVGMKEYFITHDVDIVPSVKAVKKYYMPCDTDIVRIFCGGHTLGGVCKFRKETMYKMNGFPNHIWGWGIEDRALMYRAKIHECSIGPLPERKEFKVLPHRSNVADEKRQISDKEEYIFHKASKEEQLQHIQASGLNNVEYTVLERKHFTRQCGMDSSRDLNVDCFCI